MKVEIARSDIKGSVSVPPSKSLTLRGLMAAALAEGESRLINPLVCDDTAAAIGVLRQIGVNIHDEPGVWRVGGGSFRAPAADLYCGESAATLRFMTAIAALVPGVCRLTGGPSLSRRPVGPLVAALGKLGVEVSAENGQPPVVVKGGGLKGGSTDLPGDISSQFVSALLLVAPRARRETTIRLTSPLTSRSYVLMTLWCLEKFGISVMVASDKFTVVPQPYRHAEIEIEGDWSSASYFLALGAVGGDIKVNNLAANSLQADRDLVRILRAMGAAVANGADGVTVRRDDLHALNVDLSQCIDLLPTVAVLAALAPGQSELRGIAAARLKESDRVAALKEGLERLGVAVVEDEDSLTITGAQNLKPAVINSRDDHRIAMAFGVLGAAAGNITITGAECVAKTYPGFWEALKSVGGKVKQDEQHR